MRKQLLHLLALVMLAGSALHGAPTAAQALGDTDELHVYGGWLFGDDLTDQPVSGSTPRLADHVSYGVRYDHNFTDAWGLELAAGQTPTQVSHASLGIPDLRLQTADLDVTWNFTPKSWAVWYTLMGVGYVRSRLDQPLQGLVSGQPVSLDERDSISANLGLGVRCYLSRHLIVRAEARYRYISGLLDSDDRSLNTVETTLGVGVRL
jgi:outer membrane beta-barrel protein